MTVSSDTPETLEARISRRARLRVLSDRFTMVGSGLFLAVVVALLFLPALLVVLLSFSGESYFAFPPGSWGFRQYSTLFGSGPWGSAILDSLRIAIPVVVISVGLSVPAVLAIGRSRLPGRHLLLGASVFSLVVPISAYAVALYGVFSQFHLLGSWTGLIIANTLLAFPLVMVVVSAAMSRIPVELELVAMTAGASRLRAWTGITLRLLVPSILAGALLAFITSFDEAVFINFLGGPGKVTLPKAIFDSVRFGVDPVITAIATLLMAATAVLMLLALRLRRRGE